MQRKIILKVKFYETAIGNQPVRDFLLGRTENDRRTIGADIFVAQNGFPLGLPLVKKLAADLWELRSTIPDGICRIVFTITEDTMLLLHGFVKKSRKILVNDLKTANDRLKDFRKLRD